uniref:Uncharacterized protein n=1 Tax=Rhizophora mucronata TaxID=61149 RepID=A0A2P2J2K6_RHIMU
MRMLTPRLPYPMKWHKSWKSLGMSCHKSCQRNSHLGVRWIMQLSWSRMPSPLPWHPTVWHHLSCRSCVNNSMTCWIRATSNLQSLLMVPQCSSRKRKMEVSACISTTEH